MAFSWEPFGSTRQDDPEPAPAAAPAPPAPPRGLPRMPARRLALLTCMDCRIDPLGALGLKLGDAVVLRNAGAQASDDVLRSLRLAHDALGVVLVQVVGHTDCAAHDGDDDASAAAARRAAARIRGALPALRADAALLDIRTGALSGPLSPQAAARPPSG
jgi:carbonic anhydrase